MKRNILIIGILAILIIIGIFFLGQKKNSSNISNKGTDVTTEIPGSENKESSDKKEEGSTEEIIDDYEIQLEDGEASDGM